MGLFKGGRTRRDLVSNDGLRVEDFPWQFVVRDLSTDGMADIKNVNRNEEDETGGLEKKQLVEGKISRSAKTEGKTGQAPVAVGKPAEMRRSVDNVPPPAKQVSADSLAGREASRAETAKKLSLLGGVSATDRLLGLDLRPTMTGILPAPPGNVEFLRHLSPPARRTVMRKMLGKQRERMHLLAHYLRERRDQHSNTDGGALEAERFPGKVNEPADLTRANLSRAANELEKVAQMLNILDEMLAMQDYTISQIGTFSQG